MKHEKLTGLLIIASLLAVIGLARAAEKDQEAGAQLFLKNKCTSCHTVLSKGIGKPKAKADDDDGWGGSSNKGAPDLSGAGLKRNAEWLNLWLDKKVKTEKGKKHMKPFKGSDEDQKVLVDWLASLKTKPENKTK